jgi:hypothetical protein
MSAIISVSIDMGKIDQSKVVEKNGKRFLNLSVIANDTTDNYGNNVSVTHAQSKEEREAKAPKTYLGNGRVIYATGISLAEKKENNF